VPALTGREKKVHKPVVEENEDVQGRLKVLKQQQYHISNLKAKIAEKRAELDENQQYELVRQKEDELKDLKRKLKDLMDEKATVSAQRDEQSKMLEKLKGGEDQERRKENLLEELRNIKQENKILMDKKTELEKELKKNHSKMFDGKIYIRELQKRIEQHKKRFPGEDMRGITEDDIERLKDKINELEEERKHKIVTHEQDMRDIEYMRRELERENDRLQRILTEKDREMRINSLKMKELKRIQRARATKPLKRTFGLIETL
jgi:chromosome segregation ATPase